MLNFLVDILFPENVCCVCRTPGRFSSRRPWCLECAQEMQASQTCLPICDVCGKYLETEQKLCQDCRTNPPDFHIARAVGPYDKDGYRIAIKVLKFLGRKYVAGHMGRWMAEVVKNEPRFWPIDLIIPVPASLGSVTQRGFNQTERLARHIARHLKLPMNGNLLLRVKETPAQRELTREEREKNLLCAFKVSDPQRIKGKKILLVDDVYTTGSTARECTRSLLRAGAERVCVITWATGKGF